MSEEPHARSWIRPFLAPIKPIFREIIAMSFFVNVMALAVPVFVMQVYDRVVYNQGISTLEGLLIGMVFVLIFDYVLRQARSRILQTIALRVDIEVGKHLFAKLMGAPMKALEARPSAYWQALFRDVDVVRNTLSGASAVLVADLPFVVIFVTLIFIIATPVAWVLLIVLPVFMFVAWRSGNVMAQANAQELRSTQSRDDLIAEMISSRTTIKALALDRALRPIWEEKHAKNIKNAVDRGRKTDSFTNLGASLSMLTSISLTTIGVLAIIDQQITMGALIATNMLSGRILGPLNQLVGTWRTYNGFNQSVERLGQFFDMPSERESSDIEIDRPQGHLSIEAVSFAYGEDQAPVVSNVSFKVEKGGIHALVGRNGSGKTTLLKLVQGLYHPNSGRITIDDADIAQFTRTELASWMGYVPQESVLFAGTIRDNVAKRMPGASDEEIIKAATEAGVHHFIIDMPDGYATEIGEAGARLSGGQRQRIAIARALVGDPPVILLDEPSSHLDRHAEQELRNTLKKISKDRTVIVVTHSPILLGACDYLYALDHGKLALAGPSSEILPRLFGVAKPATSEEESRPKRTPKGAPQEQPKGTPQEQTGDTQTRKPPLPAPSTTPSVEKKIPASLLRERPSHGKEPSAPSGAPALNLTRARQKAETPHAPLNWEPPKRDKPLAPIGAPGTRKSVQAPQEPRADRTPPQNNTPPGAQASPPPTTVLRPRGAQPISPASSPLSPSRQPSSRIKGPQGGGATVTLHPRGRAPTHKVAPGEHVTPPKTAWKMGAPIRPVSIDGAPGIHASSATTKSGEKDQSSSRPTRTNAVTLRPITQTRIDDPDNDEGDK
ncbi:ATP-binding cassette domain-containing protein [Varunaivibrio sulfuroxidans]|uniref:ATP-binding cassette subfamily C protein LapB n=1 Tax=Varunaivibrio sulfuroxidans TaxID=1773489 RepID=A0A4R3J687_9PROT|nr:ATP-binding cassette domain-containing protein [Varunaivibrio sulfuroxidans]TCS61348.1 ATP-binding cassette subfamily C protein LapB [Varunaivibrio sulfuroxidans]WES31039.1 ATP-binding cassette domain-containing protein [Varunaivibrio sulfuroxidans]